MTASTPQPGQCPDWTMIDSWMSQRLRRSGATPPNGNRWPCDLDAGHPGPHWTLAMAGGGWQRGHDVWLQWLTGGPAVFVQRPACPSIEPPEIEGGEPGPLCFLVEGHPGGHSAGPDARW